MATKDWKRAKSGESKTYPIVYRNNTWGDDTLVVKHYPLFNQYEVQRDGLTIFRSKSKKEAIRKLRDYMRSH
jgi:hypothetical protein